MDITCISDFHGYYPQLDGGDLLIIAGDLTANDTPKQHIEFSEWLAQQPYRHKVLIAGNHDNQLILIGGPVRAPKFDYLCDSGTEFKYEQPINHPASNEYVSIDVLMTETRKLKIWGSPWTKTFPGMNPKCKAFTVDTEEELAEKWAMIPEDIDILITHSPPFGILDGIPNRYDGSISHAGSVSLTANLSQRIKLPRLLVFGHIHESYGQSMYFTSGIDGDQEAICVNASHVNEVYEPVNKPVRIIL
jgi:hypothetical protein